MGASTPPRENLSSSAASTSATSTSMYSALVYPLTAPGAGATNAGKRSDGVGRTRVSLSGSGKHSGRFDHVCSVDLRGRGAPGALSRGVATRRGPQTFDSAPTSPNFIGSPEIR